MAKRPKAGKSTGRLAWLGPDDAGEYLRKIDDGVLTEQDLLRLLQADTHSCCVLPCRDNKRENPHCFCKLLPGPGGYRKKGLWRKEAEALSSLGEDPSDSKREVRLTRGPLPDRRLPLLQQHRHDPIHRARPLRFCIAGISVLTMCAACRARWCESDCSDSNHLSCCTSMHNIPSAVARTQRGSALHSRSIFYLSGHVAAAGPQRAVRPQ